MKRKVWKRIIAWGAASFLFVVLLVTCTIGSYVGLLERSIFYRRDTFTISVSTRENPLADSGLLSFGQRVPGRGCVAIRGGSNPSPSITLGDIEILLWECEQ
jgi:hypothetical protein